MRTSSITFIPFKFTDSAIGNFGSGWTWLVDKNGKLEIWNSSNAETPCTSVKERGVPLLTLDVWEHAYYLDHQNRRPVRFAFPFISFLPTS
jgi:superoxide dismutase, Fe-Mn family